MASSGKFFSTNKDRFMDKQLLRDPNTPPTPQNISEGLGNSYDVYVDFIKKLEDREITFMDWRYYNDGKSWLTKAEYKWTTARGTSKVKPIFWLSIWEGYFKVSFLFSNKIKDELLSLPLSQDVKKIINNTKPLGKTMQYLPIVLDVKTDKYLNDIYLLSEFRKNKI